MAPWYTLDLTQPERTKTNILVTVFRYFTYFHQQSGVVLQMIW